jgi:hypothetical protein
MLNTKKILLGQNEIDLVGGGDFWKQASSFIEREARNAKAGFDAGMDRLGDNIDRLTHKGFLKNLWNERPEEAKATPTPIPSPTPLAEEL